MKVCGRCGACYDDGFDLCAYDGDELAAVFEGSRVLQDRYRLEARLAGGGMGVVYRATHLQIGSTVAVKLMHLDLAGPRRIAAARFHREAQILGQIKHPNAVLVTDFGVERRTAIDIPYLVTEFLNGEPLSARIAAEGRLSLQKTERIISPLCEAVDEAHRIGVVHRDIKPSNIFLERVGDGSEIVKVLDFGIAKFVVETSPPDTPIIVPVTDTDISSAAVEGDTRPDRAGGDTMPDPTSPDRADASRGLELTLPGALLGTVRYMAPEQIAGEPVTPRTDVYAIATLVVRLVSGEVPITGSDEEIIRKKLQGEPIDTSGFPPKLAEVLRASLSRDAAARPESTRAIAIALRESAGAFDAPAIREPALALAVQIGAITALSKRLTGEIRTWARELSEPEYQRARDQLLALDLPLSKAIATAARCPPVNDVGPLAKELEDFDEAIEDMTAAVRALLDGGSAGSEYLRFLSVLGSRQTASATGISRRVREKMKLEAPHAGDFSLELARSPRQSRIFLEELTHRLLSHSTLESADAMDSVFVEHLELIREQLSRPDARDPLLGDLMLGLWRHVDTIVLRELFPVAGAPGLLPVLASLGIAASEPFSTIAAVFAAPRRTATAEWVRQHFDAHEPEVARALWRCALVHPIAEVRQAALEVVPRADLWTVIAHPKTPVAYERAILERLTAGGSAEHFKIFFLCTSENLASADGESTMREAFRVLSILFALDFMRDEIVFEPLIRLDRELRAKCARIGVEPPVGAEYHERLAAFANRGSSGAAMPHGMADIPLAIQRDVARRGGFISFYISHTVDAIARETLPHLLRLDDVTHYLTIPTINRSVLITLARKRHFFRKAAARIALLHNPKTPAQTARIFLPFLDPGELKKMIADKMIGADVRQLAEQYLARNDKRDQT